MGRLAGSPTVQTLAIMAVVFAVQTLLRPFRILHTTLFVLGPTFPVRPWSLVTSVYAHGSLEHLIGNAVMLALVGLIVERSTTGFRYHAFFITTGVLAGLAQVIFLPGSRVLGASGAIFALLGYVAASNRVSGSVLDVLRLGRRAQIAIFVVLAVVVTVLTGSLQVALVAHFTGFLLGLLAGRMGLLAVGEPRDRTQVTSGPPG
ncbi:rhomboid family intramembrane serine protease [Halococcus agarilyticus]|uniref:rhomboid family intramembrane serine protease n=1 Tax=Halococcus agarilyticus TaxID=1232219 RepID=UPI000677F428|nr:rhomboid family intramembrane serine protease [Halococcus agarilyticus]